MICDFEAITECELFTSPIYDMLFFIFSMLFIVIGMIILFYPLIYMYFYILMEELFVLSNIRKCYYHDNKDIYILV